MPEREPLACGRVGAIRQTYRSTIYLCRGCRARRRSDRPRIPASCSASAPRSAVPALERGAGDRPRHHAGATPAAARDSRPRRARRSDDRRRGRRRSCCVTTARSGSSIARWPRSSSSARSDSEDQRLVRLRLTALGARRLRQLAGLHLAELRRMMPAVGPALFADETSPKPDTREQHELSGVTIRSPRSTPTGRRRGRAAARSSSTSASPTTGSPAISRTRSSWSPSSLDQRDRTSCRRTSR